MADRRRWGPAVLVLVALALGTVRPAAAGQAPDVTAEQVQALALRALSDPSALAQLRGVERVDGRPVDLNRALAGAEGEALAARLRTLAAGDGGPGAGTVSGTVAVAPAEARAEARDILDGRKFTGTPVPRPFRGVLRRIGSWLEPVFSPLGAGWDAVAGNVVARIVLVVLVVAAAVLTSLVLVRRRGRAGAERRRPGRREADALDPDELERLAVAAERAGDLDRAVRLRFVVGLLRLDEAGIVPWQPSLTTGQVAARLRSPTFAGLATAFEEIAYGGRRAGTPDVESARTGWRRVLAEAGR